MFSYTNYVRAQSLEEAYTLYQKKTNIVLGGMLWLKMQNKTVNTAIDLMDLGLDKVEETEEEFRIGAYVTLRTLEKDPALAAFTGGAMEEALKSIVGVQFRNVATVGGSLWGRFGYSDVLTIFMALDAKVHLYHAGILSMEEFMEMPRKTRDILVEVIVPKTTQQVAYKFQRNTATDFPVLTCCISKGPEGYRTVVGARPLPAAVICTQQYMVSKNPVEISLENPLEIKAEEQEAISIANQLPAGEEAISTANQLPANPAEITPEIAENFGSFVSDQIAFGSNIRAGAAYRQKICRVLAKRALLAVSEQAIQSSGQELVQTIGQELVQPTGQTDLVKWPGKSERSDAGLLKVAGRRNNHAGEDQFKR